MVQAVKKQPAVRETWPQSLDWEDSLEEEEMATHSSILAGKNTGVGCRFLSPEDRPNSGIGLLLASPALQVDS